MKSFIKQLMPPFVKKWVADYRLRAHHDFLEKNSPKDVFTAIYKKNTWGDSSSVSGVGSNDVQTNYITQVLPELFAQFGVQSVLDIPCGDFYWMNKVNLEGLTYVGADIVEELISVNNKTYAKDGISFKSLNLIEDALPNVDLIFCRDCLVHLSLPQIEASLQNMRKSGSRYLLTTSFMERYNNKDIVTGNWRPINLTQAPFNLKTIHVLNEQCTEDEGKYDDKSLILIDLHTL
jgi:CheR methyltransferase, SAM binding domain